MVNECDFLHSGTTATGLLLSKDLHEKYLPILLMYLRRRRTKKKRNKMCCFLYLHTRFVVLKNILGLAENIHEFSVVPEYYRNVSVMKSINIAMHS